MTETLPPLATPRTPEHPWTVVSKALNPTLLPQVGPQVEQQEREALASLRLGRDERFMAMARYQDFRGTRSDGSHFLRLCQNVIPEVPTKIVDPVEIFSRIAHLDEIIHDPEDVAGRFRQRERFTVQDRKEWQSNFEQHIKRLMVDFELSDVPAYRLKHLDKMHEWFQHNGSKQARLGQQGPTWLTMQEDHTLPGSTKNFEQLLSPVSQMLIEEPSLSPTSVSRGFPGSRANMRNGKSTGGSGAAAAPASARGSGSGSGSGSGNARRGGASTARGPVKLPPLL
mmetsp:Transcript_82042/g.171730  ORF Transcript_82042/g.171730 Transcript_82042/m.171730 type:complete len:283 (+) Transcript_82042:344-1192(+)|eukprot:CAMPEP_0206457602 /NCGR_PEP_ID=MMETSP0324_2-20121206/23065_1 /ASSEMBLY_ACC=CAM_ASM_000836 /TAXON_ID=2866 /ORGANISM="Crypthecodinium cohnii, Strain Seligo" /LENGTH=282 /DNA_ID=CAMNT_0053928767 /DNA_START=273 /DNA_END=1121 /DNA_ORIENTATION=-